ncbi:MAG: flagellar biosynthesis chaperone [Syntrophorhabdaceae bacterium PtaU1.Bin034]|jgi:flagellar export protein FliJ|nr:MAG: flagellar biosynthesis chaperone [Syntrophorhabdaceae bacterium PtaU1.Bin034]
MSEFRYKRLTEVKEKVLEHKQRELERALTAVNEVANRIEHIRKEIDDNFNDMMARCLTGKEFSVVTGYLSYLDGRKVDLLQEKTKRENRVDGLRAELLALTIELKMLEKLKMKDLAALKKAHNKKDQKAMDDLALRNERT